MTFTIRFTKSFSQNSMPSPTSPVFPGDLTTVDGNFVPFKVAGTNETICVACPPSPTSPDLETSPTSSTRSFPFRFRKRSALSSPSAPPVPPRSPPALPTRTKFPAAKKAKSNSDMADEKRKAASVLKPLSPQKKMKPRRESVRPLSKRALQLHADFEKWSLSTKSDWGQSDEGEGEPISPMTTRSKSSERW